MTVIIGLYNTRIEYTGSMVFNADVNFNIILTDYNNNPVVDEPVTAVIHNLNDDGGDRTVSGKTNSNGVCSLSSTSLKKPCVFSIKCNGVEEHIVFDEWVVYQTGNNYTVYENLENVKVVITGKIPVTTNPNNAIIGTISDVNYRPRMPVTAQCYYGITVYISVNDNNGYIMLKDLSGSWTPDVGAELTYPKRTA